MNTTLTGLETRAYLSAAASARELIRAGGPSAEIVDLIDELDLIASKTQSATLRDKCRSTIAELKPVPVVACAL